MRVARFSVRVRVKGSFEKVRVVSSLAVMSTGTRMRVLWTNKSAAVLARTFVSGRKDRAGSG